MSTATISAAIAAWENLISQMQRIEKPFDVCENSRNQSIISAYPNHISPALEEVIQAAGKDTDSWWEIKDRLQATLLTLDKKSTPFKYLTLQLLRTIADTHLP